ncbi:MAG: family 43 glycosylhydrolase, partial [Christensenellaceae bacterium]
MRKTNQLAAGLLALLMGFSLVACEGGKSNFYAEQPDEYIESETGTVICYDNLGLGYVDTEDTVYTLDLTDKAAGMTVVPVATDGQGNVVDMNKVASFDAATGKLTAIGKGTVLLNVVDSKGDVKSTAKVQVSPAYPEDPGNQYQLKRSEYTRGQSSLMGGLHDPSLIEVPGENGQSTYYIFSTGWEGGNDIHKSTDLITWSYAGKPVISDAELTEIYAWLGTKSTGASPSWWAPDIYPAPDGGYWLYTCIVDGATNGVPQTIEGETENYSMACIVLFHSDRIDGKYTYEGVLMQSCIPSSGAVYDVNAIDPQIITTPDGRLFMAYGSFGTGNYILELNPKTGLRLDNYNKGKWLTPTEVREQRDYIVKEFNVYKNEAGDMMGWNSPYYGIAISRKDMEAPVIARHTYQEYNDSGVAVGEPKTMYYSMHSMDGLDVG